MIAAGAELFTGNVLIVIGVADGKVRASSSCATGPSSMSATMIGALGAALLVVWSGFDLNGSSVASTAAGIAAAKLELSATEAFARGILCNVLVCLAVWLSFAARSLTDKVFAVLFPISAFVMAGFEHSVANMYAIPVAMFAGLVEPDAAALPDLVCVTAGNVVGGGLLSG